MPEIQDQQLASGIKKFREGAEELIGMLQDALGGAFKGGLKWGIPAAVAFNPEGRRAVGATVSAAQVPLQGAYEWTRDEIRADAQEGAFLWGVKWGGLMTLGILIGTFMESYPKWIWVFAWFLFVCAWQIAFGVKLGRLLFVAGAVGRMSAVIPKEWGKPGDALLSFIQVMRSGGEGGRDALARMYYSLANEQGWFLVCCAYLAAGTFTSLVPFTLIFPAFAAIYLFLVNASGYNNYDADGKRVINPDTNKPVTPAAQEWIRWIAIITCILVLLLSWVGGFDSLFTFDKVALSFTASPGHYPPLNVEKLDVGIRNFSFA